MRIIIISKYR